MKRILVRALFGFVGLLLVATFSLVLFARGLPPDVAAEQTVEVPVKAADAWGLLSDVQGYSEWMDGVGRIERTGERRFIERRPDRSMSLEVEAFEPEQRLEIAMADSEGDYRARWRYQLEAIGPERTRITVREEAVLGSALFRLAVWAGGAEANVTLVSAALVRKLGRSSYSPTEQ